MSKMCLCTRLTSTRFSHTYRNVIKLSKATTILTLRCQRYATSPEKLPRVAQPSIWHSIIPKALRSSKQSESPAKSQRAKDWNPATFFICIFLLIGSNAIQMLTLRNEYSTFTRKADQKIALLKDVLNRVQKGEKVNIEKVLGTGDEQQEREWEDGKLPPRRC